ncbi:MAG: hypothetical protein MUF49_26145 [Oculatellaceae cyanobacterium Prado106]|jgi:hypothetical protein|nr:hypothetical protein [Oculatellaceae cyanobacterium Prado106]
MTQYHSTLQQTKFILGGLFMGLAIIPLTASQAAAQLNPCPGIYYSEPFNNIAPAPQGCPPNAATQRRSPQPAAQTPSFPSQTSPTPGELSLQPPLPEEQGDAIANIALNSNLLNVRVANNTNTAVVYEVIGQTDVRTLQGGEEVTLRGLPVPTTIAFTRPDGGFVEIIPVTGAEPDSFAVQLREEFNPLDENQGVLRVEQSGQVFVN